MNHFSVDYSSSNASTPNRPARSKNLFASNNDTPELASTTPIAPPPSHLVSSRPGSGISKLKFDSRQSAQSSQSPAFVDFKAPAGGARKPLFQFSTNTQQTDDDSRQEYDDDDDDMQEDEWEEEEDEDDDIEGQNERPQVMVRQRPSGQTYGKPQNSAQSLVKFSTNSQPQSNLSPPSSRAQLYSSLPSAGDENAIPSLARDYLRHVRPAPLANDPDAVVIETEATLRALAEELQGVQDFAVVESVCAEAADNLDDLWSSATQSSTQPHTDELSFGPRASASPHENAVFLAGFVLKLFNSPPQSRTGTTTPIPELLLDWLNRHHHGVDFMIDEVLHADQNPTTSEYFWDVIESLTARGKIHDVVKLLGAADFSYSIVEHGQALGKANYSGSQLQSIQTAVQQTRQLLNSSPAALNGDWHIDGSEWDAYRRDVEAALDDLTEQTTGLPDDTPLAFGGAPPNNQGLPHYIYERLKTVLNILLGSSADITSVSNDWLEASILLTVWWSGPSRKDIAQWSFDVSQAHIASHAEGSTVQHYLDRLRQSFLAVTDPQQKDKALHLDAQSPMQLCLGLILQGHMSLALSLMHTFSLCITSALVELGDRSRWLAPAALAPGMSKDDLMVLTNGASNQVIRKDDILESYTQALFETPLLRSAEGVEIDGWEIAFSIASRFNDKELTRSTVTAWISEMKVVDSSTAQRLVALCGELGLSEESRKVSEAFGDHLVNIGADYGTALLCYARCHSEVKVRLLIDLLNSYCLVQSQAYPSEEEIDSGLSRLVSNPKTALSDIAESDPRAVDTLQFYLVGYACIRRYYLIRDGQTGNSTVEQKRQAAKTLLAAINSAADAIYGGLYDAERQTAVQPDSLLPLLGEATALLCPPDSDLPGERIFSSSQLYDLLAATEDLQTVSDRVYAATEECLLASLRNYNGGALPPSPHAMLKKSVSSGTNSNFSFSMMGSEMLAQSGESLGSAVLVGGNVRKARRDSAKQGWDWRSQFNGTEVDGNAVIKKLRMGIARELGLSNLDGY